MSAEPSILGTPPRPRWDAPPPGSPPPTAPAESTPSQEDRILAALSYLGYFLGFWLLIPIVIYVLKREKSRFVAHHALRAVLLHLIAIPVFVFSYVLAFASAAAMAISLEPRGREAREWFGGLTVGVWLFAWVIPWVIYLLVTGLSAVRAFQGRMNVKSMMGRLVESFLGKDKTVEAAH
ncbi:MAG: DUF4870 domain-containing protein [Polyangiaceae bacterium]|nr:DUF4870 domain-containing protein [Polyangiaceae bacterium]